MERCKVTGFGMVPASWAYLKKMSGRKIADFAKQLQYVEIGSAFMSVEEKKCLMDLLPATRICMHYGLTEASRSTFIEFHKDRAYLESVGRPSPGVEIKVFSDQGKEVPEGEEGELCVKGGDWGYIRNGYVYLKSRKKEMINVGGKKVSPIEVEEVLNQIGGVEESVCVGMADPGNVLGEVVKAFVVVSDENLSDTSICSYVQSKLENYKVPVCIERIKEIPKTPSGKIQRLLLK